MNPQGENRRHARCRLQVEIEVGEGHTGGELRLDTGNLSASGLFLKSDLLLEQGEILMISFILPGTALAVRTRGRVVWVQKDPDENDPNDPPGMGIEFLDLSDMEQAALGDYLRLT